LRLREPTARRLRRVRLERKSARLEERHSDSPLLLVVVELAVKVEEKR